MNKKGIFKTGVIIIILTLASLSCGISNLPFLATQTPTPTATYTPSPTLTPSPTPTSTPTHTPSSTPLPTGVEVEEHPDGSTLFIDYDNQYQFIIPTGWFVIPLSSEDVADILSTMSEENPELAASADLFSQMDPEFIRVIAINEDPKYFYKGFSMNFSVTAIEDKLMSSMPLDFVTGALEESLDQQGAILVSEHALAAYNANGVELGIFEFEQLAPTATGSNIQVRSRVILFQSNGKVIMFQLAVPVNLMDGIFSMLDEVGDSIKRIGP